MTEVTKEYLDKQFNKLSKKIDAKVEDVKDQIISSVARGFNDEREYLDSELREIKGIANKVSSYDKKVNTIFDALNIKN